jgi:hypothetical protein
MAKELVEMMESANVWMVYLEKIAQVYTLTNCMSFPSNLVLGFIKIIFINCYMKKKKINTCHSSFLQ